MTWNATGRMMDVAQVAVSCEMAMLQRGFNDEENILRTGFLTKLAGFRSDRNLLIPCKLTAHPDPAICCPPWWCPLNFKIDEDYYWCVQWEKRQRSLREHETSLLEVPPVNTKWFSMTPRPGRLALALVVVSYPFSSSALIWLGWSNKTNAFMKTHVLWTEHENRHGPQ